MLSGLSRRSVLLIAAVSLSVLLLDQVSKALVLLYLQPGDNVPLIPGVLHLTLTFNPGIAFGLLADLPALPRQIVISVAVSAALFTLTYFLLKLYSKDRWAIAALSLIIGGAIGNIIDRLWLGEVIDFIDVFYSAYHWPAFNIADSAVCIGVAVLIVRPTKAREESST